MKKYFRKGGSIDNMGYFLLIIILSVLGIMLIIFVGGFTTHKLITLFKSWFGKFVSF